jgi:protein tyrosine phosphatase (PTP) superfamily phosphohydrolase (DUF442 family)
MRSRVSAMSSLIAAMLFAVPSFAQDEPPLAVNFVGIDSSLATAGQPPAEALRTLAERGYQMVINLAPPASRGAVDDEAKLVGDQGMAYVNIPVDWQRPTQADFDLFSAVMRNAAGRKVLVHCQMNMRASVFTFLYRVVHGGVAPAEAFAAVGAVWQPSGQWSEFTSSVLERFGIEFAVPAAE